MAITTIITSMGRTASTDAPPALLLIWFSPAFPVGGFSFSHGLEQAAEDGDITDRSSLGRWLEGVFGHGGGWSDAVLFALAWRATTARAPRRLQGLAELGEALQPSAERRLESAMQGEAFRRAVVTAWENTGLDLLAAATDARPLPVVAGAATAGAGLPLPASLSAYLTGFAQNLVSAAIRLAPIGQSDGLRVLAGLSPLIASVASRAMRAGPSALGGMGFRSDIASMRHEIQSTRLFRS
jgi:urease accessory protein